MRTKKLNTVFGLTERADEVYNRNKLDLYVGAKGKFNVYIGKDYVIGNLTLKELNEFLEG